MADQFVYYGAKKLRCGYTTGSCATGAVKAAAEMLMTDNIVNHTEIITPNGTLLKLEIVDSKIEKGKVSCAVIKDSGDDPDITNGIAVYATVSKIEKDIEILGGDGIGKVTKAGLDQPVGEYAINSVPRKMIIQALNEISEMYEYNGGFRVVISVPDGEKIAKKTFNPRMGIVGGISIIGTTGIVKPMSNSAIIETIRTEANMRKISGHKNLVISIGNYSEQFIKTNLSFIEEKYVTCSNFIGDTIDIGLSLDFKGILIVGHIGKLVKLGSGIMNTHSSVADGRIETLMACGVEAGTDRDILIEISKCNTVDSALEILYRHKAEQSILKVLAEKIDYYLKARVKGMAEIGAVIFSFKNNLILKTDDADKLIEKISEE